MKLAVAQTKPVIGNVIANIDQHLQLARRTAKAGVEFIVFPELSLTGYEPRIASMHATTKDDKRLQVFRQISDELNMYIGVGIPTIGKLKPQISIIVFGPKESPQMYSKRFLHDDEKPFFEPGSSNDAMFGPGKNIGIAICYELSVAEHSTACVMNGAEVYLASVAKTGRGVKNASLELSEIARKFGLPVLMSNCVGICDGEECCGGSAVWNATGDLVACLDEHTEGIVMFDTSTGDYAVL